MASVVRQKTLVTIISKISEKPIDRDACLVVIYGDDLGRKYDIDQIEVIIGRSSKADIQVDQESVSRSHAKVTATEASIDICDLGSTNGTFVNDRQVQKHQLRDGDLIKIGRTIFKFLSANIESAYHEEIYRLTTVDGLTQAYNKRYFLETLDREMSRCRRYDRALSLVMFDIDHFKKVNDTFGHLAGDYVLKTLSGIVRGRIRREDVFARYGGEEFAVVLPEIDPAGAGLLAEKVRALVEGHAFVFDDEQIPLTISIGVASLEPEIETVEEFIREADARLYRAKAGGRNRVIAA